MALEYPQKPCPVEPCRTCGQTGRVMETSPGVWPVPEGWKPTGTVSCPDCDGYGWKPIRRDNWGFPR